MHGQQQRAGEGPAGIGLLPKGVMYRRDVDLFGIPFGGVVDQAPCAMFPLPREGGPGLKPVQVAQIDGLRRTGSCWFSGSVEGRTVIARIRAGRNRNQHQERKKPLLDMHGRYSAGSCREAFGTNENWRMIHCGGAQRTRPEGIENTAKNRTRGSRGGSFVCIVDSNRSL